MVRSILFPFLVAFLTIVSVPSPTYSVAPPASPFPTFTLTVSGYPATEAITLRGASLATWVSELQPRANRLDSTHYLHCDGRLVAVVISEVNSELEEILYYTLPTEQDTIGSILDTINC